VVLRNCQADFLNLDVHAIEAAPAFESYDAVAVGGPIGKSMPLNVRACRSKRLTIITIFLCHSKTGEARRDKVLLALGVCLSYNQNQRVGCWSSCPSPVEVIASVLVIMFPLAS